MEVTQWNPTNTNCIIFRDLSAHKTSWHYSE